MIKKITSDSRRVKKGDIFVAVRGYNIDGHLFIGEAIRKGAKTIVAEKKFDAPDSIEKIFVKDTRKAIPVMADNFYGHPSKNMRVVGVTGTNGKTTITYLIENILKIAAHNSGVIGTINYRIKGKTTPAVKTTPGALELQALLAEMLKKKIR